MSQSTFSHYSNGSSQVFTSHSGLEDDYYINLGTPSDPNKIGNLTISNFEQGIDKVYYEYSGEDTYHFFDFYDPPQSGTVDNITLLANGNITDVVLGNVTYTQSPTLQINLVNEASLVNLDTSTALGIALAVVGGVVGAETELVLIPTILIGAGALAALKGATASDTGQNIINYIKDQLHDIDIGTLNFEISVIGKTVNQGVDQSYYKFANPDVSAANIDPLQHYNTYGWHEGRDPDAFFSTNGYESAYKDVAQASINPLQHYDQYGWKEGRNPSELFDTDAYLAQNSDVKAAGIDPLMHYLQYGFKEGRVIEPAVYDKTPVGGVDQGYYYALNNDVAKNGMSAAVHYDQYGWKEGRNPNAYFDTDYYLAHNPDVAAVGIDPLKHYETYGWKEGRDPSAIFDTNAYLAANADVQGAGLNPLDHFLQFGIHEGRHSINVSDVLG